MRLSFGSYTVFSVYGTMDIITDFLEILQALPDSLQGYIYLAFLLALVRGLNRKLSGLSSYIKRGLAIERGRTKALERIAVALEHLSSE